MLPGQAYRDFIHQQTQSMKSTVIQNDKQLLRKLKTGDPNALNDAYKQYRVWLLIVAATSIPDIDVANEEHIAKAKSMVEDFFIECWEQRLFKDVNVPLRTFLFRAFTAHCKKQEASIAAIP
jgi:hypothetical protein